MNHVSSVQTSAREAGKTGTVRRARRRIHILAGPRPSSVVMHVRWRLLLCAIVALASTPVAASAARVPAPRRLTAATAASPVITIRDLGYGASYSMAGSDRASGLHVSVVHLRHDGRELTLVTNPSPALRGNSLVRVFADGALVTTTSVTDAASERELDAQAAGGASTVSTDPAGVCAVCREWRRVQRRERDAVDRDRWPIRACGMRRRPVFNRSPTSSACLADASSSTPTGARPLLKPSAIAVYAAARRAIGSDPAELLIGPATASTATPRGRSATLSWCRDGSRSIVKATRYTWMLVRLRCRV